MNSVIYAIMQVNESLFGGLSTDGWLHVIKDIQNLSIFWLLKQDWQSEMGKKKRKITCTLS